MQSYKTDTSNLFSIISSLISMLLVKILKAYFYRCCLTHCQLKQLYKPSQCSPACTRYRQWHILSVCQQKVKIHTNTKLWLIIFLKKYPHNISPANTLMSKQKVNGGPTHPSYLHSKLAFLIPKNLAQFQKCSVAILQGR